MTDSNDGVRILIVEDDVSILAVLKELLTTDKTEVILAEDGESAVPHLQGDKVNLLITDLGLPGISGWEVAITAKRYQPDIRIVAITSWRGKEVEDRLAESNLDAVIWKPAGMFAAIQLDDLARSSALRFSSCTCQVNPSATIVGLSLESGM